MFVGKGAKVYIIIINSHFLVGQILTSCGPHYMN